MWGLVQAILTHILTRAAERHLVLQNVLLSAKRWDYLHYFNLKSDITLLLFLAVSEPRFSVKYDGLKCLISPPCRYVEVLGYLLYLVLDECF